MKKELRESVYKKFKGHCAYCGLEIEFKDMNVDHILPMYRGTDRVHYYINPDIINNLNPACRSCNNYKHTMNIETFRNEVFEIPNRLHKTNTTFRVAERFGMIEIKETDRLFYFEKELK